jgi:hypothetical protein
MRKERIKPEKVRKMKQKETFRDKRNEDIAPYGTSIALSFITRAVCHCGGME